MLSPSEAYDLSIRQGPERARVAGIKEKGRRLCLKLVGIQTYMFARCL